MFDAIFSGAILVFFVLVMALDLGLIKVKYYTKKRSKQ